MVTAPPFIAVVPAALVVTLIRFTPLPTAPPKVVVPLSLTVSALAPSTLPLKLTFTPVSAAVSAPSVTSLRYVCAALLVMVLVLIVVAPVTSKAVKPVTVSAASSPKVTPLAPFSVRLWALPTTVPLKVSAPAVALSVVFWPSVTLSLYVWLPVVVTAPPLMAVVPAASVVKLVSAAVVPTAPVKVVVVAATVTFEVVPALPSSFSVPLNVTVVPVNVVSVPTLTESP